MTFTPGITNAATRGLVFAVDGPALYVASEPAVAVPSGDARDGDLYLGDLDGQPCFARLGNAPPDCAAMSLRKLFGTLSDDEFAIAGRALALTTWDTDHRHCGRCGAPTERSATERARDCTRCEHRSFPRLSPAVIMMVERDGRGLLARNARTNMPFFSTLAGFVDVGETLEHAVAREVREEAGVEITDIRYFGSQPWPFTGSLMIGFTARWVSGEIVADPAEITEAAWFAPDALPIVPPRLSIARELIDDFVSRARR